MNNVATSDQSFEQKQDAPWHWQAHLQLGLASSERGTRLYRCRHKGPLYVQKPFYPEGKTCAHIYLLHPPGGLVSGDNLTIDVALSDHAHSVVTTPGAARMYRARKDSPMQQQTTTLTLGEHAIMEWFPMETIVYNAAAATVNTQINLSETSTYMGWEITCLGLPASQSLMSEGYFQQRYTITKNGLPIFIDRLHYDAKHPHFFNSAAGMQGKTVSGFFIAGPFEKGVGEKRVGEKEMDQENVDKVGVGSHDDVLETIRNMLQEKQCDKRVSITYIQGFFVIRYLGDSANQARKYFTYVWEILRPILIQKTPCSPRIWLT